MTERNTRQRRTIREVVERAGRPLSTDEILDGVPLDPRAFR
jgi:Fe2+ or Zn2+ uptake regulation protein